MHNKGCKRIIVNKHAAAIILICLLGFFLRISHINDKGLTGTDVGVYGNEAKSIYLPVVWAVKTVLGEEGFEFTLVNMKNFLQDCGATLPYFGKPGHDLLIAASYLFLGLNDYAVLMPSAILGTLSILLVFLIGRDIYGTAAGLIAALVMAVSKWAITFSVSGYAEMNSTFFGLLAIFLYLRSFRETTIDRRYYYLSALALGFAITVNYKIVVFLPLLLLYQSINIFVKREIRRLSTWRRSGGYWLVFAVPPVIMQIPYIALSWSSSAMKVFESETQRGFTSYFGSFIYRVLRNTGQETAKYFATLRGIANYLEMLWRFENILVVGLLFAGLYFASKILMRRFDHRQMVIVVQFVLLSLIWAVFSGGVPSLKAPVMVLPYMALLVGLGSSRIADYLTEKVTRYSNVFWGIFVGILVLLYGIYNSWEVVTYKSGYRESVRQLVSYIRSNGGVLTAEQASLGSVVKFYMGNEVYKDRSLAVHIRTGRDKPESDYVFISPWFADRKPWRYENLLTKVEGLRPVIEVDNPYIKSFPLLLENNFRIDEIIKRQKLTDIDKIFIYDLRTRASEKKVR